MKFKLDENLGKKTRAQLQRAGLDVHTVHEENLDGTSDNRLFEVCQTEARILITPGTDFSDLIRFPAHSSAGIVILRPPKPASFSSVSEMVENLIHHINDNSTDSIERVTTIVEKNYIRIKLPWI